MDQILSLCTGIGGLDLGLHAGLRAVGRKPRTVCMVEREAFAVAILGKAIAEGRLDDAPIWLGDLRDLPSHELPRVDWITGGYPCQPFSHAGKRLGEDDPRHLWPVILDLIRTLRPCGVFFENVAGHMSLGLDRVLQDLASCGFRSAFGLFTAEEVGAPHRRERVFILGLADSDEHGKPDESIDDEASRVSSVLADASSVNGRTGSGEPSDWEESTERGRVLADGICEGLEGHAGNVKRSRWEGEQENRPTPPCRLCRGGWTPVLFASDCTGDRDDGDLECPCKIDYLDCRCPGPTEDGIQYRTIDGVLYGRRIDEWPARPGEQQQGNEPPRTTQPGLGRNAHGLPDRVDRLRALGNAVVSQQAERAFVTLWKELAC